MAQGLNVTVTNGIPDMRVRVNAGGAIGKDDKTLREGEECVLSGPVAQSLEAEGIVTIILKGKNA